MKKISEYLRESLSDFAAEYVGKSKARSPPTRSVDAVVTKPFSLVSGLNQISESLSTLQLVVAANMARLVNEPLWPIY